MTIPTYDKIMYPILQLACQGEYSLREAADKMADYFKLSNEERLKLKPSGKQTLIRNRTGWAVTYLAKAGLLLRSKPGHFAVTNQGKNYLRSNENLTLKDLNQFPEYLSFKHASKTKVDSKNTDNEKQDTYTPEEIIENAHHEITSAVKKELLAKIIDSPPEYLELIVLELLKKMGYGGTEYDGDNQILHLGKSGDEGVDGVIKQDKLGLELIYIQAKRYAQENAISRPAVQAFSGTLTGLNCQKGVFITTSSFSKQAVEYVNKIPQKIILIDGQKLADYMYEYDLGVRLVQTIQIKKLDEVYFLQE